MATRSTLNKIGKGLEYFSQYQLQPATKQITLNTNSIGENAAQPAAFGLVRILDTLTRKNDNPAYVEITQTLDRSSVSPEKGFAENHDNGYEDTGAGDEVSKSEDPRSRFEAAIAGGGLIALAPALVAAPFVAAGVFAATGPVAGSLAALAQSSIGSVAAGSSFVVLQSAGMGGAGLALVNGVVTTGAANLSVATGFFAVKNSGGKAGGDHQD